MQREMAWMYNKNLPGRRGLIDEFRTGLELFLDFASNKYEFMDGNKLRYPCRKCDNGKFFACDKVREHFCRFGFTLNYYNWTSHDEPFISDEGYRGSDQFLVREECGYYAQLNPYEKMMIDAASQNFVKDPNHASTNFTPTRE